MQHQEDLEAQNNDVGLWIDDNPSGQEPNNVSDQWEVAAEETKVSINFRKILFHFACTV